MWNKIKKLLFAKKELPTKEPMSIPEWKHKVYSESRHNDPREMGNRGYHIHTATNAQWFFDPTICFCGDIADGVQFSREFDEAGFIVSVRDLKDMLNDAENNCLEIEKARPNFRNKGPFGEPRIKRD